jgi:hypothetical protein
MKIILPIMALALAALPGPMATGHEFAADASVTLNNNGDIFKGRVSSDRGRCERGRKVTLMRDFKKKPSKAVGSDVTNKKGRYRIVKENARGRYFVKVARKLNTPYGHRHNCKGTRSSTIKAK